MTKLIIKNGEIINAFGRKNADISCEDGKITAIGKNLPVPFGTKIIDATGQFIFPGGIDAHTHLEMPFMGTVSADDFYTGTKAAAAGGTTTIVDFIIPNRGQSLLVARDLWMKRAEKAVIDYSFHMALTWAGEQVAKEMKIVLEENSISSFKVFLAYLGSIGVEDRELIQLLSVGKTLGVLITAHCEHGQMIDENQKTLLAKGKTQPKFHAISRPSWLEGEATNRFLTLARSVDLTVGIVHLTCKEAMNAVYRARQNGQKLYVETCPQYLLLDDSVYEKPNFESAAYVMSPPIRPKGHQEYLWNALMTGQIDTIATDHCPFTQEQKKVGKDDFTKIPNGAAGIENRMALLYSEGVAKNRISLERYVHLTSFRAAQLYKLQNKGQIAVNYDADLMILDPAGNSTIQAATHHHNTDRNIFEGFKLKGKITHTIAAGRVLLENGKLQVTRGAGRFLGKRK